MSSKSKSYTDEQVLHRKLVKLWKRGQSPYCEVRGSDIHGRGVYAACFISKDAPIIEYFGEKIDKAESARRSLLLHAKAKKTGAAAVYVFTLSKRYDIDGNFPWNTARLINHACNPNCEAWIVGRKIIIHALRDIQAGEELTFDYGFDVDCYEDHRCFCGAADCKGYIVSREQWAELERRLKIAAPKDG